MKTIISKRLYSIMPTGYTDVKLNDVNYRTRLASMMYDDTPKDYILRIDAGEFNYFCFNKNNKITAWPMSRGDQPTNDDGAWRKEGRQEIKPGRFLLLFKEYIKVEDPDRAYYNEAAMQEAITYGHRKDNGECYTEDDAREHKQIRDKVIARLCEIFTDSLRASNTPLSYDVSENISGIYGTDEHETSGYLQSSCMRPDSGHGCSRYSEFYDYVPGLKIVYKILNDRLLFRALLWQAKDNEGNDVTFLDRIYGNDATNIALIEMAKENGWAWRSFGTSSIIYNDKCINLQVPISNDAFAYLEDEGSPYVDSLIYLTQGRDGWTLSNYLSGDYTLQSCDGRAVNTGETCSRCGDRISEGDICWADDCIYCQSCFDDSYTYCGHCSDAIHNDNIIYTADGHYYCDYCANRHGYRECEECGTWSDEISTHDGAYYCQSCYDDKFAYCEECEHDVDKDDLNYVTVDGREKHICDDCLTSYNKCEECDEYFSDDLSDLNLCSYCASNVNTLIAYTERELAEMPA